MNREDCLYCGTIGTVRQKIIPLEGTMYSRTIKFDGPGRKCMNCKRTWTTRGDIRDHFSLMADALREELGFLRIDHIEKVRKTNKLTREKFYKIINIPKSRYKKMLAGRIQSKESDVSMRAGLDTLPTLEETT